MSSNATAYNKLGSEMTLVVNTRSGIVWPTNIGTNWTEIRMGLLMSAVNNSDPNTYPSSGETVVISNVTDCFMFGLKNSTNNAAPGDATAYFLGIGGRSDQNTVFDQGNGRLYAAGGDHRPAGYYQSSTRLSTITGTAGCAMKVGTTPGASTGYANAYLMRLVVNNYGLSNQTIDVYGVSDPTWSTPFTAAALRTYLTGNPSWTLMTSTNKIAWNNGSAAYPLPDAFYIQNPWNSTRLRISAIDVVKMLPLS